MSIWIIRAGNGGIDANKAKEQKVAGIGWIKMI